MEGTSLRGPTEAATAQVDCDAELRILELIRNPIEKCRRPPNGLRLNLVIPVMSRKWLTFGGPATAGRLLQRLAAEFINTRIVVTHEIESDFNFIDWPNLARDDGTTAAQTIVFLGDRSTPFTVGPEDFFIATFWSTAIFVGSAIAHQARLFSIPRRRFVYLVQDYEPGFYPSSSRYVGAESTYRDLDGVIAVFNTNQLAEYFDQKGLRFKEQYVFHPILHPELRRRKADPNAPGKEHLILVYARPSAARNDFDFVVDALRIWAREFPHVGQWSVLSAGQPHTDIPLGRNAVLRSSGQMTLEEYADHLSRCWVGLSFMFSPHPSYPPLEMAEFGAWVVTNRFANKDPALLAPSIIGVDGVWPEEAARKLAWCCGQYRPGKKSAIVDLAPLFRHDGDEFPFASELVKSWLGAAKSASLARAP